MKLSSFGREARKLRIDGGLLLADMAKYLGKSPSYLSSVETSRKPASPELVEKSIEYFAKHGLDATVLRAAAQQDKKQVSIDELNAQERDVMFALARMFPESRSPAERQERLALIQKAISEMPSDVEIVEEPA